ncbi:putative cupredoxin [Helianthus annuus]|nr:putative cupredoxin [Helianthus annuus]
MTTCNVAVAGLMVALSFMSLVSTKVYIVGASAGWALSVDYYTWASDKTFKVRDSLGKPFFVDSTHLSIKTLTNMIKVTHEPKYTNQ